MLTLILIIIEEFLMPRSGIHSGDLYPRYFLLKPIPSQFIYVFEWILQISCIVLIIKRKFTKPALLTLTTIFIFGTLQVYSNHKFLVLINLLSLCLSKDIYLSPSGDKQQNKIYNFIKIQLIIVYFFSLAYKLEGSFYNGQSLEVLLSTIANSSFEPIISKSFHLWLIQFPTIILIFSWMTLLFEGIIPIALSRYYKVGLLMQIILHAGFSFLMPGILTFGSIMITMGILFSHNNSQEM